MLVEDHLPKIGPRADVISGRRIAGENLQVSIAPDQQHVVGIAAVLRPHPGRAVRHVRTASPTALGRSASSRRMSAAGNVAFKRIAVDHAGMAGEGFAGTPLSILKRISSVPIDTSSVTVKPCARRYSTQASQHSQPRPLTTWIDDSACDRAACPGKCNARRCREHQVAASDVVSAHP